MKKIKTLIIPVLAMISHFCLGQVVTHISGEKSVYEGTSYDIVHSLKLTPGFRAQAVLNESFRAKYYEFFVTPHSGDVVDADVSMIAITLREIPDMSTISSGISIVGSYSGEISGDWSQNSRTLNFSINTSLAPGERITITVSDQLLSHDGESIHSGFSSYFDIDCGDLLPGAIEEYKSICYNTTPGVINSISPGTEGFSFKYQWQLSTTSSSSEYEDIPGAQSESYDPGLLTQTTWFRRNVISESGCGILESNSMEVEVRPELLPPPSINVPTDAKVIGDSPQSNFSMVLNWEPVECALSYEVKIYVSHIFPEPDDTYVFNTNSPNLLVNTELINFPNYGPVDNCYSSFEYEISTISAAGKGETSNKFVAGIPKKKMRNYVVFQEFDRLELKWSNPNDDVCNEEGYLYIAEDIDFNNILPDYNGRRTLPTTAEHKYRSTWLIVSEPCKTYYLKVHGKSAGGVLNEADVISFESLPSIPNTIDETELTNFSTRVTWEEVNCADFYEFELKKSDNSVQYTRIYSNNHIIEVDAVNNDCKSNYEYRVQSVATHGRSNFSEWKTIHIQGEDLEGVNMTTSMDPPDWPYPNPKVYFGFNRVSDCASKYYLELSENEDMSERVWFRSIDAGDGSPIFRNLADLDECTTYYWRINTRPLRTYSEVASFQTHCTSSSSRKRELSIEKVDDVLNVVSVYPNPAQHYFTLNVDDIDGGFLEIYDLAGIKLTDTIELRAGENTIETKGLPLGLVMLRIQADEKVEIIKQMIEK